MSDSMHQAASTSSPCIFYTTSEPWLLPSSSFHCKGIPYKLWLMQKTQVWSFLSPCHVYFVPFGVSLGLSIQFHSTGGVFTALFEPQSGCSLVTSSQVPQTLLCYKHSIHLLLSQLSPLKTQRSHLGLVQATIQSVVCQNLCWDVFKRNLKVSGTIHAFSYGKCLCWAALTVLQKENTFWQWYLVSSFTDPRYRPPWKSHTLGWACKSQQATKFLWKAVFFLVNDNWWYWRQCWIQKPSVLEMWAEVPSGVNSYSFFATAIKSASPTPEDGTHPLLSDY